jgi:hypothetical protein
MTALQLVTKQRTRNVSRKGKEQCDWCDETGFVVAGIRQARSVSLVDGETIERLVEYEEVAPCPHCERGFAVEFPNAERIGQGKPGIRPPWDMEKGFWQGHSTADIRPMVERVEPPEAEPGENAA